MIPSWLLMFVVIALTSGQFATLATDRMLAKKGSSVLFGSFSGIASFTWLRGFTPVFEYFQACSEGVFGVGGYLLTFSLIACLFVWGNNIRLDGQPIH